MRRNVAWLLLDNADGSSTAAAAGCCLCETNRSQDRLSKCRRQCRYILPGLVYSQAVAVCCGSSDTSGRLYTDFPLRRSPCAPSQILTTLCIRCTVPLTQCSVMGAASCRPPNRCAVCRPFLTFTPSAGLQLVCSC